MAAAREAGALSEEDDFDPNGPALTTAIRWGCPRPRSPTLSTSPSTSVRNANRSRATPSQVTDTGFFLDMPDRGVRRGVRHRVVHPEGRRHTRCDPDGCSNDPPVSRSPWPRRRRLGHRPRPWSRRDRSASGRRRCRRASPARSVADLDEPFAAVSRDGRRCSRRRGASKRRWPRPSRRSRRRKASPWRTGSNGCASRCGARGASSDHAMSNFRDGVVGARSALSERHGRLQSFRRHQRCDRRCNRRRSAGGPQPRQLLGDGRRRR